MAKQESKYRYVKDLFFNGQTQNIVTPGVAASDSFAIRLDGVSFLPFYILGFQYAPIMQDGSAKIFNFNDPLVYMHMRIACAATGLLGDDVSLWISAGTYLRQRTFFYPGIYYDFSDAPIVFPVNMIYFSFTHSLDGSYVPVGTVDLYNNFLIVIGTN